MDEIPKRFKTKETMSSKLYDSEAVVLSVIPFLNAVDLKNYLGLEDALT